MQFTVFQGECPKWDNFFVVSLLFLQAGGLILFGWFGGMPGHPGPPPLISQTGIGRAVSRSWLGLEPGLDALLRRRRRRSAGMIS